MYEKILELFMLTIYQRMSTDLVPKSSDINYCKYCNYSTSRKSQYERHIATVKHQNTLNQQFSTKKVQKSSELFSCICGKIYKERTGLWKHHKVCSFPKTNLNGRTIEETTINKRNDNADLINYLIKENQEFKNLILEIVKKDTYNTTNNTTHTNSHNKAFNLNLFLNDTCKDAMNIMEFVDSIQLQLSDLENVGKVGYVEGITSIITKNLNALDVTQRPIHCTDKKREVLYIKDEDKWEKEDDDKKKIRKAIKRVAFKNHRLILKYKEAHPDCLKASSNYSDQYNKIIIESCGGSGDNDSEKEDKIIRNISKTVILDK